MLAIDGGAVDEQTEIVQRHNRAVRNVNRQLRRSIARIMYETDEKVALLMDGASRAEEALETIRALGGIDCDPSDFDSIVKSCLQALKAAPIGQ